MNNKIYVVYCEDGSYSDYSKSILGTWDDLELAELYIEEMKQKDEECRKQNKYYSHGSAYSIVTFKLNSDEELEDKSYY